MKLQLAMLVSDWIIYALFIIAIIGVIYMRRKPHLREAWSRVSSNRIGMIAMTLLIFYVVAGLLDSVHFEVTYPQKNYSVTKIRSLLDFTLGGLSDYDEKTYSAPFATHSYSKSMLDGKETHGFARLKQGGSHLVKTADRSEDITKRILLSLAAGFATFLILLVIFLLIFSWVRKKAYLKTFILICKGQTKVAWREIMMTFLVVWLWLWVVASLMHYYHVFGTDKVGHDVLYAAIKSIRTALLIGILTTIFMLPFAMILGMMAGYFGGWVDDIIQYLYTTLSSIPGVLLISASILVMQVYISTHPHLFPTLIQRADARLLALCIILGITSWATLCRLLRAETLKLRELEFIQASRALGVGRFRILLRHVMPNLMHIVLITIVLDFSMLVLAEAVLSYVGVGVDPTTYSWGNMINSSRLELAREPIVWWPLLCAMIFMFVLVLSANLFSDAVRDGLDPRLRMND
jgi:peptide/nickel transport system permease protein